MALDPSTVLGALTVGGGILTYIISVEHRLNGKAQLKKDLQDIKAQQRTLDEKVDTLTVNVAQITGYLARGEK